MREHFPGMSTLDKHLRVAGRKLKDHGPEATIEFLKDKMYKGRAPNFGPPAKCNIVAQSRPFEEWPIIKATKAIQEHVFSLPAKDAVPPRKAKRDHEEWFAKTGVNNHGYTDVQGLNKIFQDVYNRYKGVITKVNNRNEKALAKWERKNEWRAKNGRPLLPPPELAEALTEEGFLRHPPCSKSGFRPNILGYQRTVQEFTGQFPLPFDGYERDPDAPIPVLKKTDRLAIPEGSPGHVPEKQRHLLSTKKSKRLRFYWDSPEAKARSGLLVAFVIGDDWVVFDARGLLRSARYRKVAPRGITLNQLMDLFTGDPVIDTREKGKVTFTFKPEVLGIRSVDEPKKGKYTRETLLKFTQPRGEFRPRVGVVAMDLGQTHPIAFRVARVHQPVDGELAAETLRTGFLPDELVDLIKRFRDKYDQLNQEIHDQSVELLDEPFREEYRQALSFSADKAKALLCEKYDRLDPDKLPWDRMSSNTTYISKALLEAGYDHDEAHFWTNPKKGKPEEHISKDKRWAFEFKPKTSEAAQEARTEIRHRLQRESEEYQKQSKFHQQLARRCINWVLETTRQETQCETIIPIVEDLNIRNFHGSGKRERGWDNFFVHKKENRFLMQANYKATLELGPNRGMTVLAPNPQRTSQTCPECRHCDPDNRQGERFCCRRCGATLHADKDVATFNILQVALDGRALPKGERSAAKKKAKTSRKRKASKPKTSEPAPASDAHPKEVATETSREPLSKAS